MNRKIMLIAIFLCLAVAIGRCSSAPSDHPKGKHIAPSKRSYPSGILNTIHGTKRAAEVGHMNKTEYEEDIQRRKEENNKPKPWYRKVVDFFGF